MLEVRVLGQFAVRLDGKPLAIPSRAAQSLLAYLLVHPQSAHRREQLAGLLWSETSDENARRNLRQELWRLRKALDGATPPQGDLIASDDLTVGIDPAAEHWLDVAALERASAVGSADDLARALDVYRGELLPGFYDEWVVLERERLRALFERLIGRLLNQLLSAQRWDDVFVWAERWVAQGASPEPAYRALMTAYDALGNHAQVHAVYERCLKALRGGLGVEPSEETRVLYERLKAGKGAWGAAGSLPPVPASAPPLHDDPPYRGLRYFDETDTDRFFGREALVATLVNHLRAHQVLALVGASGSGKSSVVRAGLVPALKGARARSHGDAAEWTVHVFTPTAHPLEALAVTLTRALPSPLATTALTDDLARDPRVLRVFLAKTFSPESRLLLVIDQFEELFTLCRDDEERKGFVANLLNATAPDLDQPLYLVVALRADFYVLFAQSARLREALSQRQEFIGPMAPEELRRAIEEPARRGGWSLETGLAEALLRDVGAEPGALPLLSHALLETWKHRAERTLTLSGYHATGGVRGALAQTAESVYAGLTSEQQAIARNIFLRLVALGEGTPDTRRRVALSELTAGAGNNSAVEPVLEKLADARLITLGEGTVEVAHEALIGEWSRLREWLAQNREGLRLQRRLTEAAQSWDKLNRDEGELYRGARLAQAREWAEGHADELNELERGFLSASRQLREREAAEREEQQRRELETARKLAEAERQRAEEHIKTEGTLRRRALVLAGALVLVALLAASSALFAQQASANAERAENERRIAFVRELS